MQIDVVVVSYESAEQLPACLTALPRGTRVTVVDNASQDGSARVAASLGARVVRNASNVGFAAGANLGATFGEADLLLFLNPDAVIGEADLRRLVSALETDPATAAVGPRLLHGDAEQRPSWPFPSPAATWAEALAVHRLRRHSAADGAVPFVVGACLLVRRRAFEELGGFDERFWLYGEEADLCRRLWDSGWRVRHVADAAAGHFGQASASSVEALAFEHFQRGAEHFVAKHHGRGGLLAHRVGLLVGSLVRLPLLAAGKGAEARERFSTRRAMVARLVRVLTSHPTRVAP